MVKNVLMYLEQAAEEFPDKTGFCDEQESCTFYEMNIRTKKIGTQIIQAMEQKKNCPIAVYMDKGVACLAVFWGIAYSGNFYVPIDVKSPVERVGKIFDTLKPEVIYTQENYAETVKENWDNCIVLTESEKLEIEETAIRQLMDKHLDVDPLYVMFTSGSTGIPKGVVISHKAVIDYTEWLKDFFSFDECTVFGNQAPFYFDNSVLDIYSTIRNAATLHIIPESLFAFPARLMSYLQEHAVNTIFWVPSALIGVANSKVLTESVETSLEKVLFCGEVMPNKQLNIWRKVLPDALYANMYGPTEITDVCTCYIVDRSFEDDESLPIGYACNNMQILLLNDNDELCKEGESGEICVRGTGVAKGYYADSENSERVFVQNPLNPNWRDYIYRTGDLAKYNVYGELIYLGRKDYQIKHNGYRIELGEIEQAASSIVGVERTCAVYDDEKKRILLFCVAGNMGEKQIYLELKGKIPSYMLPSKIVIIKKFDLNANGKIDRKLLKKYYEEAEI